MAENQDFVFGRDLPWWDPGLGRDMGVGVQLVEARSRAQNFSRRREWRGSTQNFVGFPSAIVTWAGKFLPKATLNFVQNPNTAPPTSQETPGEPTAVPLGVPWSFSPFGISLNFISISEYCEFLDSPGSFHGALESSHFNFGVLFFI